MASKRRILAGAMSGTSADGVDVALTEITGRGLKMTATLLHHHHRPYDAALRQSIFQAREDGAVLLDELADMARRISLGYAAAFNEAISAAGIDKARVAAIAAHGQTLFHSPPNTIQWFDPSLLAAETGCAVVSDFRRADCAAGGQGAPLVPFADYLLFRHPTRNRVLLNIGGIANVTILPAGATLDQLAAFDTGPGNCLSDWLMRSQDAAGRGIDVGGERASRGKVLMPLASNVLSHEYFERPPPKSTDGPEMIAIFDRAVGTSPDHAPDDLLATTAFVTAASIEHAIGLVAPELDEIEVIASGGGTQNVAIMDWLRERLGGCGHTVAKIDDLGVPSEAKEAIAFALLGAATLDGEPSNVPAATGAKRRVVLGSITPAP